MAETLFITPQEIATTTILGGNVDPDKYAFCVAQVQITFIEPLLGSELYDKIKADFIADTLTGDYENLFNEFVKPITKAKALAEFIEIAGLTLANGGLFKHSPENSEIPTTQEVLALSNKYDAVVDMYVQRFQKEICKNPVPEYKTYQDEVNASKTMKATYGWSFNDSVNKWDSI